MKGGRAPGPFCVSGWTRRPAQVCARLNSGHVTLWEILNHYYYEKVLE